MQLLTWNLKHNKAAAVWPQLQADLVADLVFQQESNRPELLLEFCSE